MHVCRLRVRPKPTVNRGILAEARTTRLSKEGGKASGRERNSENSPQPAVGGQLARTRLQSSVGSLAVQLLFCSPWGSMSLGSFSLLAWLAEPAHTPTVDGAGRSSTDLVCVVVELELKAKERHKRRELTAAASPFSRSERTGARVASKGCCALSWNACVRLPSSWSSWPSPSSSSPWRAASTSASWPSWATASSTSSACATTPSRSVAASRAPVSTTCAATHPSRAQPPRGPSRAQTAPAAQHR